MISDYHSRRCVTEITLTNPNTAIVVPEPTFVHAREAVLEHSELVDLAELLEEGPQVFLVQVAGDLTDEEFDGIVVLHGDGGRTARWAVAVA